MPVFGLVCQYRLDLCFFTLPLSGLYLHKLLFVLWVLSFHPLVPPGKIQSIVMVEIMVVLIVMRGGGNPVEPLAGDKGIVEELVTQMAHHVPSDLINHKSEQAITMYGHYEKKHGYKDCLHEGFYGVEGIGRPGRRAGTAMVHFMYMPVNLGVVHPFVRPIEIEVMPEYEQAQTQKEVAPAVFFKAHDVEDTTAAAHEDANGHNAINGHTADGVSELHPVML